MSVPAEGRILTTTRAPRHITGVLLTGCGTVYLAERRHCLPGEILSRRINHPRDPQRGFLEEGHSILNYEVLDSVHPNTVRAAANRLKCRLPLLPRAVWVKVHGD